MIFTPLARGGHQDAEFRVPGDLGSLTNYFTIGNADLLISINKKTFNLSIQLDVGINSKSLPQGILLQKNHGEFTIENSQESA